MLVFATNFKQGFRFSYLLWLYWLIDMCICIVDRYDFSPLKSKSRGSLSLVYL